MPHLGETLMNLDRLLQADNSEQIYFDEIRA